VARRRACEADKCQGSGDAVQPKLIATDLDGTLVGSRTDIQFVSALATEITDLRKGQGTKWCVCTGRSLRSFRGTFAPLEMLDLAPDYAIVKHAYIYRVDTGCGRYRPHRLWNWEIALRVWRDRLAATIVLKRWYRTICAMNRGVRTSARSNRHVVLQFLSEEEAVAVADLLARKLPERSNHLRVFRRGREVEVTTIPFTKGLAVAELARHLGVDRSQILTMGDGHNDMSMLSEEVAGLVGCPANASPEIMREVHRRGGHVASKASLEGVIEILRAYRTGAVSSALPADWIEPEKARELEAAFRNHRNHHHSPERRRGVKRRIALMVVAAYVVLMVFASVGMVPAFSGLVMRSFRPVELLIQKLVSVIWE